MSERQSYTAWICTDCPRTLLDPHSTAEGIMRAEHRGENLCGDVDECDCETDTFSWSSCDGCGSHLGGERHAVTVFEDAAA